MCSSFYSSNAPRPTTSRCRPSHKAPAGNCRGVRGFRRFHHPICSWHWTRHNSYPSVRSIAAHSEARLSLSSLPGRYSTCHCPECQAKNGLYAPSLQREVKTALHHWATRNIICDERSRKQYDCLRTAGHQHARALRGLADRLVRMVIAMLKYQTPFDPQRRKTSSVLQVGVHQATPRDRVGRA
jgi:hypothetical protein